MHRPQDVLLCWHPIGCLSDAGFIYPLIQQRMGILPLCLIGLMTAAPATAAIPLASLPAASGKYVRGQVVLYASLALRQVASMNAFTSSSEMATLSKLHHGFPCVCLCLCVCQRVSVCVCMYLHVRG